MPTLTVYLPEGLHDLLREAARECDTTPGKLASDIVTKSLKDLRRKKHG